jgi:hypothetical protein
MMSEDNVSGMEEAIDELTEALSGDLGKINNDSKMDREDIGSAHADSESNPCSIHFSPTNDAERQTFSELVSAELILRDLPPLGALSTRREHLHSALKSEKEVRDLLKKFKHSQRCENALFLLIQAIPCILHMENRVGLKILTMLLISGLSNARKHLLYRDESAEGKRIERFFTDVECILNTKIIGDDMGPSQWQCPRGDKDRKELGTITLDNNRTRKVVNEIELLTQLCLPNADEKSKWNTAIGHYRRGMKKLRCKEDFTHNMVINFQKEIDAFFQIWVTLHGDDGVSNYIHMLASGHVSAYLFHWGNLYRHSQQGWEAFNSLLKTFFFRCTQRGGSINGGKGAKTRLVPIAKWLQRRIVWLCGYDGDTIHEWCNANAVVPTSQSATQDDDDDNDDDDDDDDDNDDDDDDVYN